MTSQESRQFSQSTLLLASSLSVVSTRSMSISDQSCHVSCFDMFFFLPVVVFLKTDSNAHITHNFSVPKQSSSALSLKSKRRARRPRRALYGHCARSALLTHCQCAFRICTLAEIYTRRETGATQQLNIAKPQTEGTYQHTITLRSTSKRSVSSWHLLSCAIICCIHLVSLCFVGEVLLFRSFTLDPSGKRNLCSRAKAMPQHLP